MSIFYYIFVIYFCCHLLCICVYINFVLWNKIVIIYNFKLLFVDFVSIGDAYCTYVSLNVVCIEIMMYDFPGLKLPSTCALGSVY